MDEKTNKKKSEKETKPKKKGFFSMLKESMTKTSNGCGPSCGCHLEKDDKKNDETLENEPEKTSANGSKKGGRNAK